MNTEGFMLNNSKGVSTAGNDREATVLQILRVADLLTRIGDSKVFGKELSQAQFNVLMILRRHGQNGMSQKDIVGYLVSTKGNISIHISNLTRMGYIHKKISKTDNRMSRITLTAKGRRILADLEPKYIQRLKEVTNNLSAEQAEAAITALNRLMGKCEDILNNSN